MTTAPSSVVPPVAGGRRTAADRAVRRLLRLPVDAPTASIVGAHNAFSGSIALSAVRCLFTYVFVPLLGPVVGLTGGAGAGLGLALGLLSAAFILYSVRRFFAADHRWRWAYGSIGAGLLVLLTVQAVVDVGALLG